MQVQACKSAKQLPCAAITGHRLISGISANRRHLQVALNMNKLSVTKPWSLLFGRWTSSRSTIPCRFTRKLYNIGINTTRINMHAFQENVRFYSSSSKKKYCLKRLVKAQKTNRSKAGFESIKEVVSDANESLQQSAAVLRDRMLQAVFAINADVIPKSVTTQARSKVHTLKGSVALASFTDVNESKTKSEEVEASESKPSEPFTADIQVSRDHMPFSRVSSTAVADIRLGRWHRISGAIRRIPTPNLGRINYNVLPLVSRVKGPNSKPLDEEVCSDKRTEGNDIGSSETKSLQDQRKEDGVSDKQTVHIHIDKDLPVQGAHTTTGGFDCDQTAETNLKSSTNYTESTFQATDVSTSAAAEQIPNQDSNFYNRMSALRGKLPPLSVPTSVSDKLPNISETTSKVREKVGSVKLAKWTKSSKSTSPDGRGDFDLDSPLLMAETQHALKEDFKGEASQVAEQHFKGAEKQMEDTAVKKVKKVKKAVIKPVVSKASIDNRTKTLAMGIKLSKSNSSCLIKLERLCNHLVQYPESTQVASQEKLIPCLLRLRRQASRDKDLTAQIHKTLALLGHADPVKGRGIRMLALDGGGCRGIVAIEALREIERRTNQDIRDMFDYVVGVSSGAVLGYLLSFLNASLDQCEELFRELGWAVFERNSIVGTSKLLLSHAYYDTDGWIKILKQHAEGETMLIDTAKDPNAPKVSAIANKINASSISNFVFRNYHLPVGRQSQYQGSVKYQCWEALRASSAAPGYFEEFKLDENVFQDGGVLTNNPSAVGLHECRLLWPDTPIQCLVSLGTGRYQPTDEEYGTEYSSLKKKLVTIMQSATETESVHTILQDLLPAGTYFRFNPTISEDFALDESRSEKLNQMQVEAQDYLVSNRTKLDEAAKQLNLQKTAIQKAQDWVKLQQTLRS